MDAAEQRLEVAPGRALERLMGDLGLSKKELADASDARALACRRDVPAAWRLGGWPSSSSWIVTCGRRSTIGRLSGGGLAVLTDI